MNQSENEELEETEDAEKRQQIAKKYLNLVQLEQAQMSTQELLMLFIKYNLLENLNAENLIQPEHNCMADFKLKHRI